MSSTFIVQKKGWHPSWMPRSVTFCYVTKALYEELRESDSNLAQIFLDASNSTLSFLDISSMSTSDFNKSITALVNCEKRLSASSRIPVCSVNELKVIMYLDKRCQQSDLYLSQGIIQLGKDIQWTATGWIFDLALEAMMSAIQGLAMYEKLEQARRSGVLDWSYLDGESLEQAIACMDRLYLFYGDKIYLHAYFYETLRPAVRQLYELFREQHQEAMDIWEQTLIQKMIQEEAAKRDNG